MNLNSLGQGQGQDCTSQIVQWWQQVPFFTKMVFGICITTYLIDLSGAEIFYANLVDLPYKVIGRFQIWRLLFSELVCQNFLSLLMGLLVFYFIASRLEQTVGSTVFTFDFLLQGILNQVIYNLLAFIVSLAIKGVLTLPNEGLWSVCLVYITIQAYANPEIDVQLMCFPILIKNKYYPIALILFIALMSRQIIQPVSCVLQGYLVQRFMNGILFRPNQATVTKLENSIFGSVKNRSDFKSNQIILVQTNFTPPQTSSTSTQQFKGRGIKIGSEIENPSTMNNMAQANAKVDHMEIDDEIDTEANQGEQAQDGMNQEQQKKKKNYNQFGDEIV